MHYWLYYIVATLFASCSKTAEKTTVQLSDAPATETETQGDKKLKLVVNQEKSKVARISECVCLGFTFKGKQLRWS